MSFSGELRPALLHNGGSASSTTATIKQPALGTETGPDTLSNPPALEELCSIFNFAYQHFLKSEPKIDLEHQLAFVPNTTETLLSISSRPKVGLRFGLRVKKKASLELNNKRTAIDLCFNTV